jgi:hypothetical protein
MQRTLSLLFLLAAAALGAGCASTVRVRTEPADGALVYYRGKGRPTFRWTRVPGTAPATFDVFYGGVLLWAVWPETGAQSQIESVVLSNWRDPDEIVLRADPSLPNVGRAAASGAVDPSKAAVRPAGYRSVPAFDKRSVEKGGGRAELPPPKLELPPPAEN